MSREPHIPLFLWIATALLLHLTGGEGAQRAGEVLGERLEVQRFADAVRRHVHSSTRPMEVALLDSEPVPEEAPAVAAPDEAAGTEHQKPDHEEPPKDALKDRPKKPEVPPKDAEQKRPEHREPEKTRAKEPPKPEEKKAEEQKPDLPAVQTQGRIAVVQHIENKNQEDNPNAEFIGEDANHVKEQTQARITSTDQNAAEPSPGTTEQGPSDEPGNGLVNDVAQSEDSPGAMQHAPNEQAAGAKVAASTPHEAGGSGKAVREVRPNSREGQKGGTDTGSRKAPDGQKSQAEREARAGARATPESPDVQTSKSGTDEAGRPSEQSVAQAAEAARPRRLPPRAGSPNAMDFLGLGASGTTSGGINLNLTPGAAIAAIGRDALGRERVADGERRRSRHRGSWRTPGIEKWRAAIENYNSTVKPGNQTALNTARVPFATYLNQIHNRLHPIFADSFLASLDGLPADHPLNKPDMRTNLEIILDKGEGKIVKMGITRSSGSTVFDVAALESVQNAAPFGTPPSAIVSPDGNVYLHWEFYRNPYYACSTYFARPFILKGAPGSAPPHIPPPASPPFGPKEDPIPARGDVGKLDLHETLGQGGIF